MPRQAEGEWWELADTTRQNRSYFYNTLTKVTQWTRPGGDAFVIPLGLIQSATLPKRVKADDSRVKAPGPALGSSSSALASTSGAGAGKSVKGKEKPVARQDSIQLHHKGINKKRSKQQLRNATSSETIKPSSSAARQARDEAQTLGKKGGRSRAATVTASSGPSVRFPSGNASGSGAAMVEKPLPAPPSAHGSELPPHPGFPGFAGDGPGSTTPTSPFGPRIPLPPDSPSTPSRIAISQGWSP